MAAALYRSSFSLTEGFLSAAFATPFGYQTNVLVFQMGGYSYMDFVRVGVPLNLITWAAAMVAIPIFFPF